jgi:hypothetical protein
MVVGTGIYEVMILTSRNHDPRISASKHNSRKDHRVYAQREARTMPYLLVATFLLLGVPPRIGFASPEVAGLEKLLSAIIEVAVLSFSCSSCCL